MLRRNISLPLLRKIHSPIWKALDVSAMFTWTSCLETEVGAKVKVLTRNDRLMIVRNILPVATTTYRLSIRIELGWALSFKNGGIGHCLEPIEVLKTQVEVPWMLKWSCVYLPLARFRALHEWHLRLYGAWWKRYQIDSDSYIWGWNSFWNRLTRRKLLLLWYLLLLWSRGRVFFEFIYNSGSFCDVIQGPRSACHPHVSQLPNFSQRATKFSSAVATSVLHLAYYWHDLFFSSPSFGIEGYAPLTVCASKATSFGARRDFRYHKLQ